MAYQMKAKKTLENTIKTTKSTYVKNLTVFVRHTRCSYKVMAALTW